MPVVVLAAAWIGAPLRAQSAERLPALNSYAQPPFTLTDDRAGGLAARLLAQLNDELAPALAFQLEAVPRRRLEMALDGGAFRGLALFLAPEFLPPAVLGKGERWSAPVMVDENLIVTVRPLDVPSLDALRGLRLGGIVGHVYRVLGPRIEAGEIERDDAIDHVANLRKLCLNRVDFVVISRSELAGTAPLAGCARPLRFTPFPQPQVIVRRVLVRMADERTAQATVDAVGRAACSERWRAALAVYGLSTAGCTARPAGRGSDSGG
ncbi:hypothetical protein [Pelomonas cellulosilytica]|uniref:Solute-binding protein family 3/N-terminal domain-containing protein n=1 Tax=Pelomonas cellulosilytica TaxID=2906762 RepID=A0ABS8XV69_9BURK|nr:hypothetical protein [Pelomonas sp. P8]MCE4555652.1 hypothetical protein [Pelomonas sp. P8]